MSPSASDIIKLDRRTFLQLTGLAGGGLMLGLNPACSSEGSWGQEDDAVHSPFEPGAYVQITDKEVVIQAPVPEIGQGVKTALPMIVAEELDASWDDVRVVQAPTRPDYYGRQSAGGSRAIPKHWDGLREAGALARSMLVTAAATRWKVPTDSLQTRDSRVIHPDGKQSLSYFELAEEAATLPVPSAKDISLKAKKDYRLLGQRISGVDNPAIVTGQPLFGLDQKIPNMLYAAHEKCPATGGRVKEANLEEIRALPGVIDAFIMEGNNNATEVMPGVAILAKDTGSAFAAKKRLRIDWDLSEAAHDNWANFLNEAPQKAKAPGAKTVVDEGDVDVAFEQAAQTVEAEYSYAFIAHAQLEPQNCTAFFHDGQVEIWAPTQTPEWGIQAVASALDINPKNVTLHTVRSGAGFGRRLMNDAVCEAAAISKHSGQPVKLTWTREDDMQHDFYRAGAYHALKGAVDKEGRLSAWQQNLVSLTHADASFIPERYRKGAVMGGNLSPYVFPGGLIENQRTTQTLLPWKTPCGALRAPGSNVFAFVAQGFLAELSTAAGRDHREFLLEVLGPPRWLQEGNSWALNTARAADVVKLATQKAGWGRTLPEGRGLGLAFYFSHAGHFAEVAEVSVTPEKKLTVHKVTVAGDVGPIINRSAAENQVQGSVIDGLSAMLAQKSDFVDGRVQQTNFDTYPLLRIAHTPEVDVHFVDSDYSPTGLGEPALPPLAPAVANAIFAANGHRIRSLPLSDSGYHV